MTPAQTALLERLRVLIAETPTCGAVNAAGRAINVTRFAQAVEARADDGDGLVKYVRGKVHGPAAIGYRSLIEAGRPDLTVEAVVADADAPWSEAFSEEDRAAAQSRLGSMLEEHREATEAVEAEALAYDNKIADEVSARRTAKGKPALTDAQRAEMLAQRSARRTSGG